MATYSPSGSQVFWPCRNDDTTSASHRRTIARNDEVWFRMYGDNLQFNHRCTSTTPISIMVDSGSWVTASGFTTFSTSVTNLSTNVLPSGTTDDYHNIRIRTRDGGNWIALRHADGIVITSTSGTAELASHPDAGEYERVRGTRGLAYWRDTFTDTTNNASFTSPIFPRAQVITGSTKVGRNAYAEFYVSGATTKLYAYVHNIQNGGQDGTFSLWVDRKRYTIHTTPGTTDGVYGLVGPITVPGSGTRLVRLVNLYALDAVVVNGAFIDTAVDASALPKLAWVGDSVTAGDSVTTAYDAAGNWDHLCEILSGKFKLYNRGLSGAAVAAFNSNSRANDLPTDCSVVINNLSINDATAFNSSPTATIAAYVTMYQAILTRCPSATLLCVPQLSYQSANRTAVITGIQQAVTDVNDPRCIYVSSDGWVSGLNDSSHPRDMGKAQACGGGVAAIRITAQPADGNTITINGTIFEFDNNASVSGGNISVTIGATLVETIENLALAIEAANASFTLFERVILASDTTNQGVVVRGCTSLSVSGTNLTAYGPESTGWMNLINTYFPSTTIPVFMNYYFNQGVI